MKSWVLFSLVVSSFFQGTIQDGQLIITLDNFKNPDNKDYAGEVCDKGHIWTIKRCDPFFVICVSDMQNLTSVGNCPLLKETTGSWTNTGNVDFNSKKLTVQFRRWKGHAGIFIEAWDDDILANDDDLIDKFSTNVEISPRANGTPSSEQHLTLSGKHTTFKLSVLVRCNAYFFGSDCRTRCRASDRDEEGHYNCSQTGSKICHNNWYGPDCQTYCLAQNKTSGHYECNKVNGTKICRDGWYGKNCTVFCYARNDTQSHYSCDAKTGAKKCNSNWYGSSCNVSCVPKSDKVNGHYNCNNETGSKVCQKGWYGANCTKERGQVSTVSYYSKLVTPTSSFQASSQMEFLTASHFQMTASADIGSKTSATKDIATTTTTTTTSTSSTTTSASSTSATSTTTTSASSTTYSTSSQTTRSKQSSFFTPASSPSSSSSRISSHPTILTTYSVASSALPLTSVRSKPSPSHFNTHLHLPASNTPSLNLPSAVTSLRSTSLRPLPSVARSHRVKASSVTTSPVPTSGNLEIVKEAERDAATWFTKTVSGKLTMSFSVILILAVIASVFIVLRRRKRKRSEASLKSKLEFSETGGKSGFSNLTYDNEKADAMFEENGMFSCSEQAKGSQARCEFDNKMFDLDASHIPDESSV